MAASRNSGPTARLVRVIASDVYLAKAKGDIVRYTPSTPDRVDVDPQDL